MTWPPPPTSDPWESHTVPPGGPPPPARPENSDETGLGDEHPGHERPAPPPNTPAAEPPFPVPVFDPDWGAAEADAAPPVDAPPADPTTTSWEVSAGSAPGPDVPLPSDPTWETPSDPVIQPIADPELLPAAPSWDAPREPVDQPVVDDLSARPPAPERPVTADGPPPEYGSGGAQWSTLYTSPPPPVVPRTTNRVTPRRLAVVGGSALGLLAVVALGVWLVRGTPTPAAETEATPTSESVPVDSEAQARLLRAVPAGYGSDACVPANAPGAAIARVTCGANGDPGGPDTSTYTLYADRAGLDAAFTSLVNTSEVVVCPGRIQSPGPWRRNATPDKVSGTLVCALDRNRPSISWTNTDELLIGSVEVRPGGTTFDALYAWWAAHS